MSRKKSDAFAQTMVGAFMILVTALLGYFTIVISGVDLLSGRNRIMVEIAFDHVGGLKNHDSVMYRGTKVGTVEKVVVTSSNLVVVAEIDESIVLRRGYRAAVCNLSMLGGNYLLLEEGTGEAMKAPFGILSGETPSDWMSDVSAVARNLRQVTSMGEIKTAITNLASASEKASRLADSFGRIAGRLERGEGTIGKLLSEEALYDDLRRTMSGAASIVKRIDEGEGTIGKLLSRDDTLHGDLKSSLASFKKACESFDLGDTKVSITNLVADADRLVKNLNAFAVRLAQGKGTIGRLVDDPELYDEANNLVKDIRQVVDNYRDTTPITTFTSLLTGGL